uniref:Uncharacterized protein n=1 Tax=Sphaerodactylus townsendi TaxID=933632 RepID=A0ACB8EZV5_9SAUR
MQPCYEKMDQLKSWMGCSERSFEQMDDAVYTFESLLHQELSKTPNKEELCKTIQRILERVLKKYDYDSSTVRKKFFREALLQITVPFLLKKLAPTCKGDLPKFQELIFEDFSRFILVENTYEEVVLQSVMKDIMLAVKEAAVQRKHNLYRDSIVMHNSDPNLHLLSEGTPIDWGEEYGGQPDSDPSDEKRRRAKQVVSVIHVDEAAVPYEVTSLEGSPEVTEPEESGRSPGSPDSVKELRGMLVKTFQVETPVVVAEKVEEQLSNGTVIQESKETAKEKEEKARAEDHPAGFPGTQQDEEQEAVANTPASPSKLPTLAPSGEIQVDCLKPSDKETGEEVSARIREAKAEPPSASSHEATEDSEGIQTRAVLSRGPP